MRKYNALVDDPNDKIWSALEEVYFVDGQMHWYIEKVRITLRQTRQITLIEEFSILKSRSPNRSKWTSTEQSESRVPN
jgi:hypothetical protein